MNTFAHIAASLAAAFVLATGGGGALSAEPADESAAGRGLRSIPVVHIPYSAAIRGGERFPFALANVTDRPIRYLIVGKSELRDLDSWLYRDGKFIPPTETACYLNFPTNSNVRTLKPGEAAQGHDFPLDKYYGRLKPGRYEVRAKCELPEASSTVRDFGLTPLEFEQTVMILDVGKATESAVGWGASALFPACWLPARLARAVLVDGDDAPQNRDVMPTVGKPALRAIPVATVETTDVHKAHFQFAFPNETGRDFHYMGGRRSCALLELSLFSNGKLVPHQGPTIKPPIFAKSAVRTLKPGDSLEAQLSLGHYTLDPKRPLTPGRYEIQAKYNMPKASWAVKEFGLTPLEFERTVMSLHIETPLPKLSKLKKRQHIRVKRAAPKYYIGADVGLAPTAGEKETLFFVVRETKRGKAISEDEDYKDGPPDDVLRLMEADPKAQIETMLYHPFPQSREPIILVHVLVSEPDKPQRHFVVDLSRGADLQKNETLKPGARFKLHKTKLGDVKLAPRAGD